MKFRKIEFVNHPIFGSVFFDFTDADGNTVNTIILAGENGCGKSLLLSFLNTYNPATSAKQLGYKLKVEVELSPNDLNALNDHNDFANQIGLFLHNHNVTFVHDTTSQDENPRAEFLNKEGNIGQGYAYLFNRAPIFKTILSDVEIDFTPSQIKYTTSNNLDSSITGPVRSTRNLATEIKQLIIDINELDNEELGKWVDAHKGQVPVDEVIHKRIRRFTKAFDKIFPNKRFVGIDNRDNQKHVLFEEFGKQMEISQLSSGEKQIVFRGGFLLCNLGSIKGCPILVDEPELSLHPQWQLKILGFLKSLFTDENGVQTSQLIVATHSPFVVHNNTRANDKVLVMRKDEKGAVVILDKPEYYDWAESITVKEAFNVSPLLVNEKTIVFLEGETDEIYFRKAMEVFGFNNSKMSFHWIGRYVGGDKGKAENTGDKSLNNAAAFFKANPIMMQSNKIYLLYDCDTNKPDEHEGNLYVGAMTKNKTAVRYMIGVENLLNLPHEFDYSAFYKTNSKIDDYGASRRIEELDKDTLSKYITNLPNDVLKGVLSNLKCEIEKIIMRIQ